MRCMKEIELGRLGRVTREGAEIEDETYNILVIIQYCEYMAWCERPSD